MVNNCFVKWEWKLHIFAKPPAFSSMPLQSSMFTINRNFIIGLVSSITTAAIGYVIRLILLNYLEYDVFSNLDNWRVSLSYFCSLGATRFIISEFIKQNFFLMSTGDSSIPGNTGTSITNITSSIAVTSTRGPNNPGIGSSSAGPSSIPGSVNQNTTGLGNSSTDNGSIIEDRLRLQQRMAKVEDKIHYFHNQSQAANQDLYDVLSKKSEYISSGRALQWDIEYREALSGVKDCETNLVSEQRMHKTLTTKLENGDYSMSSTSTTTKRGFSDSSMTNDDSSTATNTKRRFDDK